MAEKKKTTKKKTKKKVEKKPKVSAKKKKRGMVEHEIKTKTTFSDLGSRSEFSYWLGCPPIDIPLGLGARSGKIYEIHGTGDEDKGSSVGKTTIAVALAFAFCDYWIARGVKNFKLLWIETESALDVDRLTYIRPDLREFFVVEEAETVEDAHELMEQTIKDCVAEDKKCFMVWDTLAAAITRAQKETGDAYGGGQMEAPRKLRQMLRALTPLMGKTGTPLVLVNQTYESTIKKFVGGRFIEKRVKTPYGGGGIIYHSSVMIELQKMSSITTVMKNGEERETGILVKAKCTKNKLVGIKEPFFIEIKNEGGLDYFGTMVRYMTEHQILKIAGSWKTVKYPKGYFVKGEKQKWTEFSFQQIKKLEDHVEAVDPHLKEWLEYLIYDHYAGMFPLIKCKTISKIWKYEKLFFGEAVTELTDHERKVADAINKDMLERAKKEKDKGDK